MQHSVILYTYSLPNRRTIRGWLSHVKAEPGFTGETMDALLLKAQDAEMKGKKLKVSLALDDIALKEHIDFDGHKVCGYVDMGDDGYDDPETKESEETLVHVKATHACTFMVTCLNDRWKIPCGYFFIKSLGGTDRAALTRECVNMLEDMGIEVEALTFDGHASNIAMAHELGASLHDPFDIKPFFPNPFDPSRRINIILDACHMVKLVRNCLGENKLLFDGNGDVINWCFIEELLKLQTEEGLRLANKLAKRHIDWKNHKMRVRVAVQTFSASVADAIEYCETVLNLPNFQGSAATVKFIRTVDRLFDILNSSSPIGRGFKAPLSPSNIEDTRNFLFEAKEYISKLTVSREGESILKVRRKTGFLGFITCILSVIDLYDRLVDGKNMRYFLTYKLSQDHLEMFFGCIRQRGGFNNNPTCTQFKSAYKSLIIHNEIRTAEKGNCIDQSQIKILSVSSRTFPPLLEEDETSPNSQSEHPFFEVEECLTEETRQMLRLEAQQEHNIPDITTLSRYVENVTEYISGWVANTLAPHIDCKCCKDALFPTADCDQEYSLIAFKNRGGLTTPSASVVKICKYVETCYREWTAASPSNLNYVLSKKIPLLCIKYARECNLFSCLDDHLNSLGPFSSHFGDLVQSVANRYLKVRLHHSTREENDMRSITRSVLGRQVINMHM